MKNFTELSQNGHYTDFNKILAPIKFETFSKVCLIRQNIKAIFTFCAKKIDFRYSQRLLAMLAGSKKSDFEPVCSCHRPKSDKSTQTSASDLVCDLTDSDLQFQTKVTEEVDSFLAALCSDWLTVIMTIVWINLYFLTLLYTMAAARTRAILRVKNFHQRWTTKGHFLCQGQFKFYETRGCD